jgi:hypothetical protein
MKKIDVGQMISILANFGVIAGIVFLAMEVRQNTAALDREVALSSADTLFGQVANSDYLPEILEKVHAVQGSDPPVPDYMNTFGLSHQQAQRLSRYLRQVWLHSQADWIYSGRDPANCITGRNLITYRDNQILFSVIRNGLDPDYVECVESSGETD